MSDNISLVSKDRAHTIELPLDEPAEITNYRAQGWATAEEHEAADAAAQAPPADNQGDVDAPDPAPNPEPEVKPYAQWLKADLEKEVDTRNQGRVDDARIVVEGKGTVADLSAALGKDDAATPAAGDA